MKIVVPDADDLGVKFDPLKVKVKTEVGEVRPVTIPVLLNRAMRRRFLREMKKKNIEGELVPVKVPEPITARETTDRMAQLLIDEYEIYKRHFPAHTLAQYLDARTAEIMIESWKKGKPLDRDAVRRGIANLWQNMSPERAAKARN